MSTMQARIGDHENRLRSVEAAVQSIEGQLPHLATREGLEALRGEVHREGRKTLITISTLQVGTSAAILGVAKLLFG